MADIPAGEDKWAPHLNLVAELYVGKDQSYDQIRRRLELLGLDVSEFTVKAQLKKWGISRFTYEEELKIMASHLLHQQTQHGHDGFFYRWNIPFPGDEIQDFLARYPDTLPSDQRLPAYLTFQTSIHQGNNHSEAHQLGAQPVTIVDEVVSTAQTSARGQQIHAQKHRKRPRQDVLRSRSRQTDKLLPHRPKRTRDTEPESEHDSGDNKEVGDDIEGDMSTNNQYQKLETALTKVRKLTRDMGYGHEDVAEALLKPEKLRDIVTKHLIAEKDKENTDLGPLHYAAYKGNVKAVETLLTAGADINARGGSGFTPLHAALHGDQIEVLKVLAFSPGVDLNAVDNKGVGALCRAIVSESPANALLLLKKGADVDTEDILGKTPLHWACLQKGMKELVEEILTKTKKINHQDRHGQTALHKALAGKNWDYVIPLLRSGTDLNLQDESGRTAMHQACFHAPAEILMDLVQEDADFTIRGHEGETVLHLLCQRDLCHVAEIVAGRKGTDVNARRTNGLTPLIQAVIAGSEATVRMLVDKGADVTILDSDLDTALTVAIQLERHDLIDFLIKNGSPLNPQGQSRSGYKAKLAQDMKVKEVYSMLAGANKTPTNPAKSTLMRESNLQASNIFNHMPGGVPMGGSMSPGFFMRVPASGTVNGPFNFGNAQANFDGNHPHGFMGNFAVGNAQPAPNYLDSSSMDPIFAYMGGQPTFSQDQMQC